MGTIKTTNIETITGSGTLTIGQSGETISIPSGVTFSNSGTATGFGANTPAFFVYKNTNQTISDVTQTKITWNTTVFDTHTAFASDKFTVPSGHAGKYYFTNFMHVYDANEVIAGINRIFRKNGSQVSSNDIANASGNIVVRNSASSVILDLSVGDYVEVYMYGNTTDNTSFVVYGEAQYYSYFYGYKLIT